MLSVDSLELRCDSTSSRGNFKEKKTLDDDAGKIYATIMKTGFLLVSEELVENYFTRVEAVETPLVLFPSEEGENPSFRRFFSS